MTTTVSNIEIGERDASLRATDAMSVAETRKGHVEGVVQVSDTHITFTAQTMTDALNFVQLVTTWLASYQDEEETYSYPCPHIDGYVDLCVCDSMGRYASPGVNPTGRPECV
jgi:hypothetical protein